MSPVSVVTDSTSYLPPELIDRHRIEVVPLYVVFGGDRTVPEIEITDYPAFFEELRTAEKLPTTSQPSVGDFRSTFEPLLADGGEVVSVHISGGLSGTPEAARQAKEALTRDGRGGEHINAPDQCAALVERCQEIYGTPPTIVSEIGPVLSAHTGPGLLGTGAVPRHFVE